MREYTIHPLAVGINETDQGVMTYLRDYGKRIYLPNYAFYLKGGDQTILVDTGLAEFVAPVDVYEKCGFEVMEFEAALEGVGLTPEAIDIIIHTHLHNDHCENDDKCPNAKIIVQKAEYEFLKNPHPVDHRYYDALLVALPRWQWQTLRWREGSQGWLRAKFVSVRCWRVDGDGTRHVGWLIGQRPTRGKGDWKYFWSNFPLSTPLTVMVEYTHRRYWVEQFHEEAKSLLGWDQYQKAACGTASIGTPP